MTTCYICFEEYIKPVSLPCGHLFCTDCLVKTIQAVRPVRSIHACPICRGNYSTAPVNPAAIPAHLRPFVSTCIRRVYLDTSPQVPETSSSSNESSDELVRQELIKLRSENQALRNHCIHWRRRAELHGAATLGLLDFSRMVRDQAVSLAHERDELKRQCGSLKRKLDETADPSRMSSPTEKTVVPPFTFSCPPQNVFLPAASGMPNVNTVENSRLAVAALLDLRSGMDQIPSSSLYPNLCPQMSTYPGFPTSSTGSTPLTRSRPEPPTKRLRRSTSPHPQVRIRSPGALATSSMAP